MINYRHAIRTINPSVINVSRVINKVFESHIEKRKDDLDEVIVVFDHYLFYSMFIHFKCQHTHVKTHKLLQVCEQVV